MSNEYKPSQYNVVLIVEEGSGEQDGSTLSLVDAEKKIKEQIHAIDPSVNVDGFREYYEGQGYLTKNGANETINDFEALTEADKSFEDVPYLKEWLTGTGEDTKFRNDFNPGYSDKWDKSDGSLYVWDVHQVSQTCGSRVNYLRKLRILQELVYLKKENWLCRYTGLKLDFNQENKELPEFAELDHLIPRMRSNNSLKWSPMQIISKEANRLRGHIPWSLWSNLYSKSVYEDEKRVFQDLNKKIICSSINENDIFVHCTCRGENGYGSTEWKGVKKQGKGSDEYMEVFSTQKPYQNGNNHSGEYLAVVEALRKKQDKDDEIDFKRLFTNNPTAIAWVNKRSSNPNWNKLGDEFKKRLKAADEWIQSADNTEFLENQEIILWDCDSVIPADFRTN